MFSRRFLRVVAIVIAAVQVSSCAEIDRRGGIVDQVEDWVLFKADTKTHRLMRSYLLVTVLLTAARRNGHNDVDRTAIAGALEGALAVANEAYMCLYPGRKAGGGAFPPPELVDWSKPQFPVMEKWENLTHSPKLCQFFDEKMSRLDYALYRLASVTLFNEQSRQTLGDIRTKLIGKIPVLSDAAVAAIHANKAVNQLTTILDDLLNLAFDSLGPSLALLPLYRDSLELNMWVIADNARLICQYGQPPGWPVVAVAPSPNASAFSLSSQQDACNTGWHVIGLLQRGNGNVKLWREFIRSMNGEAMFVEAYPSHFFLVSQLLIRSCKAILVSGTKQGYCQKVLEDALETALDATTKDFVDGNTQDRVFMTSLPLPGAATFVMNRTRRPRPSDLPPTATGSVAPQATQQQKSAPSAPAPVPAPATTAPPAQGR